MSVSFCIIKEQLQSCILSTRVFSSLVSEMYMLKEVCYLATSIAANHFFYGNIIISREHLKRSICQGHCVYFTTLVAAIHIVTIGLWLIREKLKSMFISGKPL